MVATYIKVTFFGFVCGIIGLGIAKTFVPQLHTQKKDFTLKSNDKRFVEMRPKDKYMDAIKGAMNSKDPYFGPKPKNN